MYNDITIGYLSWKKQDVFRQTLESHRQNGLFDAIPPKNRLIFFQEISKEDIKIAEEFKCKYTGNSSNIGILKAFIQMVEKCKTEYFIFCENDWKLIEDQTKTFSVLTDCINMLKNNKTDIIRLRHRKNPGEPLYSRPENINKWLKKDVLKFPYKLESLSWLPFPNETYNNLLEEFDGNDKWYITTLTHQFWSNNVFIGKTEYIKNNILPLIKKFKKQNEKYSGLENVLINNYKNHLGKNEELDSIINNYKNTRISGGEGLFTHKTFVNHNK
jgi:hypothetical protein